MSSISTMQAFEQLKEKNNQLYHFINDHYDELIRIRRDFRKNPELSFEEVETSEKIAAYLKEWGYAVQTNIGRTGVIGVLHGKEKGKVIGLRADMDALPMDDEIDEAYRSVVKGSAHTCGHDVHMTNLLGVAKYFGEKGLRKGTIKVIFQPAEEIAAGAYEMIEEGALKNPDVDAMIGLHVHPTVKTGEFSITSSRYSGAAADSFNIKVFGKEGHAAYPHNTIDPITITSHIIVALQSIVSRYVDPVDAVVISVGKIQGGMKGNIIPNEVAFEGTVRTLDMGTRAFIVKKIEKVATAIAESFGGRIDFNYEYGPPSIDNNPELKDMLSNVLVDLFGKDCLKFVKPGMGGEDFAFFSQKVPSIFFRLGTKSDESTSYSNHHAKFNVDEQALKFGIAAFVEFVNRYLK